MRALIKKIRQLLKDRRFRKIWYRGISATAAVVVFITTYALVLPAITMETEAKCGIPAHQHTTECYEEQLICGQEESDGHHHTDDCYTVTKELTCEIPEHKHDKSCFDEEGNLTCSQDEHSHSATCYEEHRELTCGLEESDGHHHDSSCYKQVLTCGLEAHIHSAECYKEDSKAVTASTSVQASEDSGTTVAATAASTAVPVKIDDPEKTFDAPDTDSTSSDTFFDTSDISPDAADTSDKVDITDTNDTVKTSEADSAEDMTDNDSAEQTSAFDEASPASPESDSEESNAEAENASIAATTDVLPEPVEQENLSEGYVPTLDPINMERALDKQTGFYYYHAEEGEDLPATSAEITSWKKVDDNTKLAPTDLIRAYFAYTIPAGQLNETNQVARYRLPSNIHLTDDQIIAINQTVNGVSVAYVDQDTDTNNYNKYLGAEAIEGTRTPDKTLVEGTQEYIAGIVKAENVYENSLDDESNFVNSEGRIMPDQGDYLGQDLIFIFTPYSIEKNQNEYDSEGKPIQAGEPISGWFVCDFNTDQVDWSEPSGTAVEFPLGDNEEDSANNERESADANRNTVERSEQIAEVIFATEGRDAQGMKVDEIRSKLTMVHESEIMSDDEDETTNSEEKSNELEDNTINNLDNSSNDEATNGNPEKEKDSDTIQDESLVETNKNDKALPKDTSDVEEILMPAMSFEDSIRVSTGKPENKAKDGVSSVALTAAEELPEEAQVTVRVEADEGTFPAGTKMVLSAVEDMDSVANTVQEAIDNNSDDEKELSKDKRGEKKETIGVNQRAYGFQAVDISFFDVDGNEVEPEKSVRVALTSEIVEIVKKEIQENKDTPVMDPVVVHIDKDGKTEKMDLVYPEEVEPAQGKTEGELLDEKNALEGASDEENEKIESQAGALDNKAASKNVETEDSTGENATVNFNTDSFSVYTIVYTVDFHWDVNGNNYEFSLNGGDSISFRKLISVLGILEKNTSDFDDTTTENERDNNKNSQIEKNESVEKDKADASSAKETVEQEEIDTFLHDIENVTFSAPELIWVENIQEDSTAGDIIKKNKLNVIYSGELSETDIARRQARKYSAPDWILVSIKPFNTEEKLTVTMKTGEVFTILVTDNQAGDPLGLNNEVFVITNKDHNRSLKAQLDSKEGCIQALNPPSADLNNIWKFEYDEDAFDGKGGYYLVCEMSESDRRYLRVQDNKISLADTKPELDVEPPQGATLATPFTVIYNTSNMLYRISADKNGNSGFLTYESEGGTGRFKIDGSLSENNLLAFRDTVYPVVTPGTVGTWDIKSDKIVLKLFDYDGKTATWNNGRWNQTNTDIDHQAGISNNNSLGVFREGYGINYHRSLLFSGSGNSNLSEGFNNFTGKKTASFYSGIAYQNIVKHNLGNDKYPALQNDKIIAGTQDVSENGSLAYLFNDINVSGAKTVYAGSDGTGLAGLLRKDEEGYYYYDSEQNYARLKGDEIILYSDTYKKQSASSDVKTEKIGLFPFDDYDPAHTEEKTPTQWGGQYHHQFGMTIGTDFVYPPNGILPEDDKPMTFEFSGDDDVWVFIDGVLVLDLGGVHQPISGKIDFNTGKVTITEFGSDGYEYPSEKSTTIEDMFKAASREKYGNETSLKFNEEEYSKHRVDFYYLERGGCDSNCKIKFNLLLTSTLTLEKKVNGLTEKERQKYRDDLFNLELNMKHSDKGLHMHSNEDSYWANTASWRTGFDTYETKKSSTDANENHTIKKEQDGSTTNGIAIDDGQITLKDGEAVTVTHLPKTDVFYVAEEDWPVMQQFETPHAERIYKGITDSEKQEREERLYNDISAGGGNIPDWGTRAYNVGDSDHITYTNTLREKNLKVRKIWQDTAKEHDPVQFKLLATVEGEAYSKYDYINAQWTETKNNVTTTKTEDVYISSENGKTFTLSKDNGWEIDFEHLPAMTDDADGTGKEIIYSVQEVVPDGYSVSYIGPKDTNEVYLDLFKLWPDGNENHNGSSDEKKVEDIYTYVKRSDGKYITARQDTNGEYVYTGVVDSEENATEFHLTSKTQLSGMKTTDQHAMFDYAVRINGVPKSDGAEENPVHYFYSPDQKRDEDPNTTGLVMFMRPKQETQIINAKGHISVEKEWLNKDGTKLDNHPDHIGYTVYQLKHEHEWAVYDGESGQWDYSQKANGEGWYVIREPEANADYGLIDGLEKRICRFSSCSHYTEERTMVAEPCSEHSWGDWIEITPATCTEPGEQKRTCQRCKQNETSTIAALGHNYEEAISTPATCDEPGVKTFTCSRCGDSYTEAIPQKGHDWGEWVNAGNNQEKRTCKNDSSHFQIRDVRNVYPGTTDLFLVEKEDVWPVWEHHGTYDYEWKVDLKQVTHSGIFKHQNKYYVIIRDAYINYYAWNTDEPQTNYYVIEVKGSVRNVADVYGKYSWIKANIPVGGIVKDSDGNYYVRTNDPNGGWSGPPNTSSTPDTDGWYKVPNYDDASSNSVGTNSAPNASLFSARLSNSGSHLRETTDDSSESSEENNNTELDSDNQDLGNQEEGSQGSSGGRGNATNRDLTLSILLSDLNLEGLGVKNHDTGDTLTEYKSGNTLPTTAETVVEGQTNLWRAGLDVPLTDKNGNPYKYYVVENDPSVGGDYEITYSGQEPGLDNNGTVRITNKEKPKRGALRIKKIVTLNNKADTTSTTNGTYKFSVVGVDGTFAEGIRHTLEITFVNGKATGYRIDAGSVVSVTGTDNSWEVLMEDLVEGDYIVTETDSGSLTLKTITGGKGDGDVTTKTVSMTVTPEDTTARQATAQASFTNNIFLYEIIVVKVDTGSTATKLGGAKFDLYAESSIEEGRVKEGEIPLKEGLITSRDSANLGKVSIGALIPGTYYLVETKAPDGYILPDKPIKIVISETTVSLVQDSRTEAPEIIQNKAEVTVMNTAGVELPSTGGPGIKVFMIIGGILVLGSGTILMMRRMLSKS